MLLVLFLSLLVTESAATGDNTMIVVWGKPMKLTGAVVNATLDQNQCVQACLDSLRCVAAHIMLNTTTCNMFYYNNTPTVMKTRSINESVVAFKITGSDTCPIGENGPTFDNKTATGYILLNDNPTYFPAKLYYNISFTANQTWIFSNKIVSSCTMGSYLQHPDGNDVCCIMYQVQKSTNPNTIYIGLNQTFSVNNCKTELSAYLPAMNYANDPAWFEWYLSYFVFPTASTYVRIDGRRTTACQATPGTPTCMSPAGFTFTDPNFKNFDNYNWVTNSSARAGTDDDCLVLLVVNGTATSKVDVKSCTNKNTIQAFGHICTMPAYQG